MEILKVQMDDCKRATRKQSDAPVLDYCRKLIKDGVDADTKLEVYDVDVLALTIRTIKEGALFTVKDNKYGAPVFARYEPFPTERLKKSPGAAVHAFKAI